jgi:hypothetical protein
MFVFRRRIVCDAPGSKADELSPPLTTEIGHGLTSRSHADSIQSDEQSYLVHRLVSSPIFDDIMEDYVSVLYALIPVVHIPTFLSHLQEKRYHHDLLFQMFCLAISGCIFAVLPHEFERYTTRDMNTGFRDRRSAIDDIHHAIVIARPPTYYDRLSHEKWAISYLFSVTNAHLGYRSRAKLQFAECNTIVTELGMHRIASYHDLDHVERQLRKKAFWLSFIGWSSVVSTAWSLLNLWLICDRHMRTRDVDWDSIADQFKSETADAEHLMPLEIDDEYITISQVCPQPEGKVSVVTGLTVLILITDCLVPIFPDESLLSLSFNTRDSTCRNLGSCVCGMYIQRSPLSASIVARFTKATRILEGIPLQLSYQAESCSGTHFGYMMANIHVTHVWIRSLLLERLMMTDATTAVVNYDHGEPQGMIWQLQEDICKQLIDMLNNISEADLKPNGYILVRFIRTSPSVFSMLIIFLDRQSKSCRCQSVKQFT